MELDATGRKELSPQDRQKHMQNRTCFNCRKPGHMACNCKARKGYYPGRDRRTENSYRRRGELNATGRGAYDGPMQLNATLQGPSISDMEAAVQGLQGIALEGESDSSEENTPEGSEDELLQEMSEEDYIQLRILAGDRTAEDVEGSLTKRYEDKEKEDIEEFESRKHDYDTVLRFMEDRLAALVQYKLKLYYLTQAVETQIKQAGHAEGHSTKRSQQYQDKLSANIDYLDCLYVMDNQLRQRKKDLRERIRELRERDNVARIDHPRHAEMTWSACYTDNCLVHYSSKQDRGYYPEREIPVY
ncbi:hypothetical protein JKG47_21185 [Acidithiobacillus sp. MC6.1]|nr:hypothetical protein [Acidithiobacillus sp. MC6.1]